MTASKLNKLVAVFGVGAKLSLTVSAQSLDYSDAQGSKLSFKPAADEPKLDAGVYDVEIVSETELKEVFAAQQPTPAAPEKKAKASARQSPDYGYETKQRF